MAGKQKRKGSFEIPIARRLPNPPAAFVGRRADLDRLETAIRRAPVTLVSGPGGIGKTALVLECLHRRFGKKVRETLFFDVPQGEPAAQVRFELVRTLASLTGASLDDVSPADPEAMTSLAIDLAETGPFIVVLDDVYRGDTDETHELLIQLASFARESRFVATSRLTPRLPELAGQVLTLSVMADDEMRALATEWAPSSTDAERRSAVVSASGSPWLLFQLLVTGASEHALAETGLLSGLPNDAVEFVRVLALLEAPHELETIALLAPRPDPDALSALERRGLVLRSSGGWRIHDVARGMLQTPQGRDPPERLAPIAATLAQHESAEVALEGARIFAEIGRIDALHELLDRRAEAILRDGYGPRLWRILKHRTEAALGAWRLRCAAELGNPTALSAVAAPVIEDDGNTLAWARSLRAGGDTEGAVRTLERLRTRSSGDLDEEAALLLASSLAHRGRFDEALTVLDAPTGRGSLTRDALGWRLAIEGGRDPRPEGAALAARVASSDNAAAARHLAEGLLALGNVADAAEHVARVLPRGLRPELFVHREALLAAAAIALARGEIARAGAMVDELRPFARGASILLPGLGRLEVERRALAGELAGLEPFLDACAAESAGIDAPHDRALDRARVELATLRGRPVDRMAPAGGRDRASIELALARLESSARHRGELSESELGELAGVRSDPRQSIAAARVRAVLAITSGDVAEAARASVEATRTAVRAGARALEAECRVLVCDALFVADRRAELATEARALAALAGALGSARFEREASFYLSIFRDGRMTAGSAEALATLLDVAPVAARRAQAVLGAEPDLDHVDLRVLETLTALGLVDRCERVEGSAPSNAGWQAGWGIDERRGAVWLPDGSSIDLSAQPQVFRLLVVLADRRGSASKETLVCEAWGESEYHALRHDGKLRVAVRRLRAALGDGEGAPEKLLTTESGYRLGGSVRRIRA